ncbi:MAG: diguanylate cyclase [Anaerolineae bacterium]|nr:diguanylate cyclase [Anaerolineae bacterium]
MIQQDRVSLTGLYSEEIFKLSVKQELIRRTQYPSPVALMFMSLIFDEAKLEHAQNMIQLFAGVLNTSFRISDIPGHYGDDFLILLPGTDGMGCQLAAERMIAQLGGTQNFGDDKKFQFKIHIGITSLSSAEETTVDNLIHEAELALREAQAAGPLGYKVYSRKLYSR